MKSCFPIIMFNKQQHKICIASALTFQLTEEKYQQFNFHSHQPHFKCSGATDGWWLLYWKAHVYKIKLKLCSMSYGKWFLLPPLPTHLPAIANIFPSPICTAVYSCLHVWISLSHIFTTLFTLKYLALILSLSWQPFLFCCCPHPNTNTILPLFSHGNALLLSTCNGYVWASCTCVFSY